MPSLRWRHENADGKLRLIIDATPAPRNLVDANAYGAISRLRVLVFAKNEG